MNNGRVFTLLSVENRHSKKVCTHQIHQNFYAHLY
jgi:hypothetical protein